MYGMYPNPEQWRINTAFLILFVLVFAGTALMQTGRAIEIISITMGTYLFLSLTISVLMNSYNKKMAIKEK